ncbi:MAG: methionyl-tRNA formyltransferase [Chloroflexi bacterium]|nr:methionyl-tRNA formyltransferase [Chloroflexota bacterium]
MSADNPLKVVFMGTPVFSVPVLTALVDEGHRIVGVYTRRDRPTGRGKRLTAPPVKLAALERGLPVFQPSSLRRDEKARQEMASLSPDVVVVAAYGLFLPPDTLSLPRLGCLNIHPSLLPRYRGSSPVVAAVLSGDAVTGVTVMKLDEGMDSGPLLAQRETPIGPDETAEALTMRLFELGSDLLIEVLPKWERGEIQAQPQDESMVSVTSRLSKEDGEIDWNRPAAYIARQVRAYYPWPGTFTHWRGATLKIVEATAIAPEAGTPASAGQVVLLAEGGVGIGTGEGILELRRVQLEGRGAVSAREFVQGHRDFPDSQVGV